MTEIEFVNRATNSGVDKNSIRSMLASYFHSVQKQLDCLHGVYDAFYITDYILRNQNAVGDIVEFGCYQGGMSCKLAKVAQLLNKKYFIFDSFIGLPVDATYPTYDHSLIALGEFKKGMFACSRNDVKKNLQKFGVLKNCELISGLIEDTLPKNHAKFCCIFIDVDIASTAQFILKTLWKDLQAPGIFTHEACVAGYMEVLLDKQWWRENFQIEPPRLGSNSQIPGLPLAGCLDFLIKNQDYKF